ncbi:GTP cyclohydrolase II [Cladochytrium tenue]|nr:GTP cyclohydrolase II [Cladochytrium tenue]
MRIYREDTVGFDAATSLDGVSAASATTTSSAPAGHHIQHLLRPEVVQRFYDLGGFFGGLLPPATAAQARKLPQLLPPTAATALLAAQRPREVRRSQVADGEAKAAKGIETSAVAAAVGGVPASVVRPVNVRCEVRTRIPSVWGGEHHVLLYSNDEDGAEHLALVWGYGRPLRTSGQRLVSRTLEAPWCADETEDERVTRGCMLDAAEAAAMMATADETEGRGVDDSDDDDAVLTRLHSCCFTGETLGSQRCDCQEQLQASMRQLGAAGRGVVVYLQQEGRGIGLRAKLQAYNLIDRRGLDTLDANLALGLPADARRYGVAAAILRDLGVRSVALLTNNPGKVEALERDGVQVARRVGMVPESWEDGERRKVDDRDGYLIAKARRMGHLIDVPAAVLKSVKTAGGSGLPVLED